MVIRTRSPLGSGSFSTSMVKSIALMIPSPNFLMDHGLQWHSINLHDFVEAINERISRHHGPQTFCGALVDHRTVSAPTPSNCSTHPNEMQTLRTVRHPSCHCLCPDECQAGGTIMMDSPVRCPCYTELLGTGFFYSHPDCLPMW
jgi:hypothetical protein